MPLGIYLGHATLMSRTFPLKRNQSLRANICAKQRSLGRIQGSWRNDHCSGPCWTPVANCRWNTSNIIKRSCHGISSLPYSPMAQGLFLVELGTSPAKRKAQNPHLLWSFEGHWIMNTKFLDRVPQAWQDPASAPKWKIQYFLLVAIWTRNNHFFCQLPPLLCHFPLYATWTTSLVRAGTCMPTPFWRELFQLSKYAKALASSANFIGLSSVDIVLYFRQSWCTPVAHLHIKHILNILYIYMLWSRLSMDPPFLIARRSHGQQEIRRSETFMQINNIFIYSILQ